jgi:hypothetical protein
MISFKDTIFMVKFNFYENKNIPQYAKVKVITIINNACLIEDINTFERAWVMNYDIYPLNEYDIYGEWEYSKYYDEIAIANNLK